MNENQKIFEKVIKILEDLDNNQVMLTKRIEDLDEEAKLLRQALMYERQK